MRIPFWVGRGMQIASLTREQIETVHEKENKRGYLMYPFEVGEMFSIPSPRTHWGVPDDPGTITRHLERIKRGIEDAGILDMTMGAENGAPVLETNLRWTHSFDWAVYNNSGNVVWECMEGKGGNRQAQRILKKLEQA